MEMLTFAHFCLLHRQIIEFAFHFILDVFTLSSVVLTWVRRVKSLLVKSTKPVELKSNRYRDRSRNS